jgi:hypothetical protein
MACVPDGPGPVKRENPEAAPLHDAGKIERDAEMHHCKRPDCPRTRAPRSLRLDGRRRRGKLLDNHRAGPAVEEDAGSLQGPRLE